MAELNGETPVEDSYRKHLIDVLRDDDSDDDDDDTVSNVHESVSDAACFYVVAPANSVFSPHLAATVILTPVSLSRRNTILTKRASTHPVSSVTGKVPGHPAVMTPKVLP